MGSAEELAEITRRTVAQHMPRRPPSITQKISHPALAAMKSNASDPSVIANHKTSQSCSIHDLTGETERE